MDVTSKNFMETLPIIEEAISSASFLSFDGEFTGLTTGGHTIHAYDTPEERYHKLRKGSTDFLLLQCGLCAFKVNDNNNGYTVKSFNFYIFPRQFTRQAPDVTFCCQASSIDFLLSQGFDFNKAFREGISYLTSGEESRLRQALEQKYEQIDAHKAHHFSSPSFTSPTGDQPHNKGPMAIPDEQKDFIESVCQKIDNFLNSDEQSLDLDPCTGFQRKLVYQTATQRFKQQVHLEAKTNTNRMRYISVSKVTSEEDRQHKENQKRQAEFDELDRAVGFCKVVKLISQSGKLFVGHNLILDLLHLLHRFMCPLPQDYEEFKVMARCIFSRIIDTKVMATTAPLRDFIYNSTLGDLQRRLQDPPFKPVKIETAEGFPEYTVGNSRLHEAGYDAFITGHCLAGMANFLGQLANSENTFTAADSPLLKPFLNKLFLMRVQDIPYMNLAEPDLMPPRDHVFYVTFPSTWKATDLSQLFSAYGNIYIAWLDDSSAFISLYRKDQAAYVLPKLAGGENYRVITYNDYMAQRGMQHTPVHAVTKRKVPASDLDLPPKRKRSRSSDGNSPYMRAISTIPEEDEAPDDTNGEAQHKDKKQRSSPPNGNTQGSSGEDIGEPVTKKTKRSSPPEAKLDKEKLFEEPDW